MFLLCLVRVVVICLLLYILGTLFININTMESTSTGWGYVIIHLPPITLRSSVLTGSLKLSVLCEIL